MAKKKTTTKKAAKKSEIALAAEEATAMIEEMASVRCPLEEYVEALETVQTHLESELRSALGLRPDDVIESSAVLIKGKRGELQSILLNVRSAE